MTHKKNNLKKLKLNRNKFNELHKTMYRGNKLKEKYKALEFRMHINLEEKKFSKYGNNINNTTATIISAT